jgi:DNA-binding PucR family transcriptional regulator
VTAVVRTSYQRALVQGRSDQVVALLPLGTEAGDHQTRSHALGLQVQQAIAEWKPGFTVSVGFSAPIEAPAGVAGALREVTSVMESLARFKRWSQVVAVPELGLTGLLAAVSDERLVDYSRRHLGPLIEHDRARKGALVATLRAYLETGEQQHAAQRLRVHPNTLRYRLDRIREITGLDLEDPETRLNLSVALRVQSLLGL